MSNREVIYYDVSPFAALSASGRATNITDFSDVSKLFKENQVFRSIQTCEKNYTVLDGTHCGFVNDERKEPENIALWNTAQNSLPSRELPFIVTLDVSFGGLQSSSGIAFYFDRENNVYCDCLNVKWYRGSTLVSDRDFNPDSAIYSCINDVEFYDRVQVTFRRLNMPYRYFRLEAVIFGIVRFFADDSLESLTINEGADPTGRSIYISTAEFTINMKEPVPYLFLKRQPVYIRYNAESIGVYYVDKSRKHADMRYSIQAVDKVGVLDNTEEFIGGMYNNVPAEDIIHSIVGGLFDVIIDEGLKDVPVTGWIPICKKRIALAQVALAIGAIIDASRTGEIKVRQMPQHLSGSIGRDRVYTTSSVDIAFPYTGIELIEHNYIIGSPADTKDLFKDTFTGEKIIKFSKPHSNYQITNGTIINIGVNFARISSTGAAECILRGRAYIDNQNSVIITAGDMIEGTEEKIEKIENGYLVNSGISWVVAKRLYNYYQRQNVFNGDILLNTRTGGIGGTETRIDEMEKIGDIVTVATGFKDTMGDITGQIEKLALNLGYKNIKARGIIRGN